MKLAFCLFKYFPYGGLQRDFLRIARECQQRGHEIHVYTMQWEGDREPGFHVHLIKVGGWQNHTRCRSFAEQCADRISEGNYDLVIGFNRMPGLDLYYAADVCYQARAQAKHAWWYTWLPRYRQQVAFEQAVFAHGTKTQIMLISPFQQQEFVRHYQTEKIRFHMLPPGIAKDRVAPPNAEEIRRSVRAARHIADDDILLLMVGSGFKTKGLDRSIAALAALPEALKSRCHLFVIGQDNAAPFENQATQLHVRERVHFLGGRPDVPQFFLAADLLLHPAYHENTGTVLLEALVSGLPVLTVDVCGYAHYVAEANAGEVLPSPFSQTDFNAALVKTITSGQRKEWHANALAFAENADIYSMPAKVADLIEQQKPVTDLTFEQYMSLRGECFRHQEGRLTQRVMLGNKTYFIKQHTGVGWKEIFKNLLQLRLPVLGAKNEWLALEKLKSLGVSVPAVISYGSRGSNPATQQSYVLMEELRSVISLEDLCKTWPTEKPPIKFKRMLIEEVARMARIMHENGINHRDFYICHILLDLSVIRSIENGNTLRLYLIDLHRAQIRRLTPQRWIIKDLSGLYFSSKDIGLTKRDIYRFMEAYRAKPLRQIIQPEKQFWNKVKTRGEQLYRDHAR